MSANFTTESIDQLRAARLDGLDGWEITFRSTNEGMHHQLYANGQLADWTDTTNQRRFFLSPDSGPREVLIAAVNTGYRTVDFSENFPAPIRQPSWVYRTSVVRPMGHSPADRLLLLSDHATGEMADEPLLTRDIYPQWVVRWAWGEDSFGLGGFGYGGINAPGLGRGTFGAGPFGMGGEVISISATLNEEGTHQLTLRAVDSEGQFADYQTQNVTAMPPPNPPAGLTPTEYDSQTNTLTLRIE